MRRTSIALIALLVGCSDSSSLSVVPVIERVEVVARPPRADARADMLRERNGEERILSDARDAWTIPIGSRAVIEFGHYDAPDLSTAAAIFVLPGGPTEGRVRFVLHAEGPATFDWNTELDVGDANAVWSTMGLTTPKPFDGGRVEMSAEWVGTSPPNADLVRAAFMLPSGAHQVPVARKNGPNVLVITVDTLRSDRLGCYGYSRATSPNIDRLAARGTRFANAYSSAPWTLPSYGSLFTGLLPGMHRAGVVPERDALFGQDIDRPKKITTDLLCAKVPTLAEQFAAAGFATVMFHNNHYLSRGTGLERGFERYVHYESNAANGVDLASKWISNHEGARWFAVVHLMDPHFPYAPPAPFDQQFAGVEVTQVPNWPPDLGALRKGKPSDEIAKLSSDLYDGEIAFTDQQIGRLLDELEKRGELANTIVVLHSDHGEEFWEHGSCDHGVTQNEEVLRVPVVIVWPENVPAGRVVEERVRALDLFATLLDLTGLRVPDGVESRTLRPLFTGSEVPRRAIAEAVHDGAREIKAVFDGLTKLVQRGADVNVFDLAQDSTASMPTSGVDAKRIEELRAILSAHHRRSLEAAECSKSLEFDDATRARLKGIGY